MSSPAEFYSVDNQIQTDIDALRDTYSGVNEISFNVDSGDVFYPTSTANLTDISSALESYLGSDFPGDLVALSTNQTTMLSLIDDYDASRNRLMKKDKEYQHIVNQLESAKSNTHFLFMMIWIAIIAILGSAVFMTIIQGNAEQSPGMTFVLMLFMVYVLYYVLRIIYYYVQGYKSQSIF